MKKSLHLLALVVSSVLLVGISTGKIHARLTGTTGTAETCWGAAGVEVCVDSSGNWIPTTTNVGSLGTSSLKWKDLFLAGNTTIGGTAAITGNTTITGTLGVTGATTLTSTVTVTNSFFKTPVSTQALTAGVTIDVSNSCGGVLRLSAVSNVTTDTTNTLSAPSASNFGCVVTLFHTGGGGLITLDNNARFLFKETSDLILGTNDTATVVQIGTAWVVLADTDN